eukprot:2021854-Pyramimonas_sp.AAC.1
MLTPSQAVEKRPGLLVDPPKNVLSNFCCQRDMFLEPFWLILFCFSAPGLCSKSMAFVVRTSLGSKSRSW